MAGTSIRASLAALIAAALLFPLVVRAQQARAADVGKPPSAAAANARDDRAGFRAAADGGAAAAERLRGRWIVESVRGDADEVEAGTMFEFTADKLRIVSPAGASEGYDDEEPFRSNDRQIFLPDADIVIDYRLREDSLTLRFRDAGVRITLRREAPAETPEQIP